MNVNEIIDKIEKREEECLKEIYHCVKTPENFEDALADGYFNEKVFEDLIINYANYIETRRKLYEFY